uniref:Cyclin-dependent kinase-activating kinase n=1 Tax=Prosthecobacter dejongeii TaxID=48465 RepID=Q5EUF6_9BACT|nr:cyclin-dependent kinase-activating kinase [Prosthecobacter dejongeii]
MLARLQHPHIVAIYDFGRNASGHLFIVMEYVEGTSLLDLMKKQPLSLSKTLEVITQVCEALQFAHDHGVIHRDIKPTNILLDVRGRVRVADFGLAKLSATSQQATTQSRTGMVMGTPGYAAPEQRRAEANLDHRADIFSTGVTLYELLTGHLPVGVFEPPSKKSDAPALLDKVVTRALRERPADRYQRASDMQAAIRTVVQRLEQPLMQRAIAKRPIVSMMTSVIVGAGLIYLLDALNTDTL